MKRKSRQIICAGFAIAVGLAVFHAGPAFAQAAAPDSSGALTKALADVSGDGRPLSLSLQILVLMSLLTVLPSLILMMTSFTRIIIVLRSEEHTSELQSLMRISYAVFCLKKQPYHKHPRHHKNK